METVKDAREFKFKLYRMKLGSALSYLGNEYLRVPGGWLIRPAKLKLRNVTPYTFVAYHFEFKRT